MVESKSTALPLGDAPTGCMEKRRDQPAAHSLWQRRSIEGVEPFQPAGGEISHLDQILKFRPWYQAILSDRSFVSAHAAEASFRAKCMAFRAIPPTGELRE